MTEANADTDRRDRAKGCNSDKSRVTHTHGSSKEADHSVRNCGKKIKNKYYRSDLACFSCALHIDVKSLVKVFAQAIAKHLVKEENKRAAKHNTNRTAKKTYRKTKGKSRKHLDRLCRKKGNNDLEHREDSDGDISAPADIAKRVLNLLVRHFLGENVSYNLNILARKQKKPEQKDDRNSEYSDQKLQPSILTHKLLLMF